MRGVFDDRELEEGRQRRDTELTLTSTTLLGIFFGLVLLCGLCFGLGFALGRSGSSEPATAGQGQAAVAPVSTPEASSKPKPSATAQNFQQPQRSAVNSPVAGAGFASAATSPETVSAGAGNSYGQPQVRPALPPPASPYQPAAQPGPAPPGPPTFKVQPALPPASSLMVQIAAVTHPEDAEVLVGALRKRGYAVSVRRDPADNLIHVQIGPFYNRDEAYRWRQTLLNDGYNAIVQP